MTLGARSKRSPSTNATMLTREIQFSTWRQHNESIIARLGCYASFAATAALAGYSVAQIMQLAGLVAPPIDAYLVYGFSLAIAAPFVIAVVVVHHVVPPEKRLWSHLAGAFAIMYAAYVSLNYVVQMVMILPATDSLPAELRHLDQTPHSLFWNVDALGYICMGISTGFLGYAIPQDFKWLRRFLFANALMVPVISFVYFYPHFSPGLLLVASPWILTATGSLLLLFQFFRHLKHHH